MADATIELGVKPVLDLQYTKKTMSALEKELRSAQSGVHANLVQTLSKIIRHKIELGEASSATQARMTLEGELGGRFSPKGKALLRTAQNIAQVQLTKERATSYAARQLKAQEQKQAASLSSAYDAMKMRYEVFKGTPSESNRDKLLNAVLAVKGYLANLSKDSKTDVANIKKIQQDTKTIGKEASEFKFTKPSGTANAFGAVAFLKGALIKALGVLGLGSLFGALKTFAGAGVKSIQEGYNDLVEQSVYGANRNIAGTRGLSKMYGMKEESLVSAERYALDFRQRMMMGEVSDREFIALSKMRRVGQMVVSGEAGRNPQQFQKALQEYIRTNKGNEAEVRQNLRYLGLNPEIMAYGAIEHEPEREKQVREIYEGLVRQNKISALSTLIPSEIVKRVKNQIGSMSGEFLRLITGGEESANLLYRSMTRGSGFTAAEVASSYEELAQQKSGLEYLSQNGMLHAATLAAPGIAPIQRLLESNVDMQVRAAETYKALPSVTKEGTKEGAKEGVIEGLREVLQNSANRSNFDQTIMGLASISLSNRGAN